MKNNLNGNTALDLRKYFDSAEVTIAGEKVSGLSANVNKDDELVVTFKDVEIAAKQKAEVIVNIALVEDFDEFGDQVQLIMTDYVAVDGKVESRVSSQTTYIPLALYSFNGGKVKIENTKLGNVDVAQDSEDVVVAEGTITVPESVKGTFTITAQ
jgi:putative N-acetylmannosamine-6-phosphate epimerase